MFNMFRNGFTICIFWRLGASQASAMDDDSSESPHRRDLKQSERGKQGEYLFPTNGVYWIWRMTAGFYIGLSVRDLAANRDLCSVDFTVKVKSALPGRGRRTNTSLPEEDLHLLKEECNSGITMSFQHGSLLREPVCLPVQATLKDVEHVLQMACPWSSNELHRLEITTSTSHKLGETSGSKHVVAELSLVSTATGRTTALQCDAASVSEISKLITSIGEVLVQLNQQKALSELEMIRQFMQVTLKNKNCQCVFSFSRSDLTLVVQLVATYPQHSCSRIVAVQW